MPAPSSIEALKRRSPRLFRLFRWYARRYASRHFHAVRLSIDGRVPELSGRPVVVVLNHPSWWDLLVALIVTGFMPEDRVHYAPIEAVGLSQYPFLSRVGFFGVETGTAIGAARFLRTSLAILSRPESVLWVTAQGEFVDPRVRPARLRPGVGHLAHRISGALIVPMALEYPFWNDRCPEALVRFGRPITMDDGRTRSARDWTAEFERSLEDQLEALADEAMGRDPGAFTTLISGTAGVGGIYDAGRRIRAWLGGRTFDPQHVSRPPAGAAPRPFGRPTHFPEGRNSTV
jgi:1-acyl-sn-glycerol-3-phosphate acyltransferase